MKKIYLFIGIALIAAMLMTACKNEVTGIKLGETMLIIQLGEQHHLTAAVEPKKADQSVLWLSSNINVVSVDDNGILTAKAFGNAAITAKAGNKIATCKVNVIPADGAFINGVIWATCNVDAFRKFAAAPESSGKFYQWNRKTAWAATGDVPGGLWNSSYSTGTTWEAANDPCPYGWRVPSVKEFEGLIGSVSIWTTQNGVIGQLFGTEPNQIFMPAAGERQFTDGKLQYVGRDGNYWSNSLRVDVSNNAHFMYFRETQSGALGSAITSFGYSVRCVKE